jgi:hypothetical protein
MRTAPLSAGWGRWRRNQFNVPGPSSGGIYRIDRVRDEFSDPDTLNTLWTGSYGTYSITGGRGRVACDTNFNALLTAPIYTLADSYFYGQVFPNAVGGAATTAYCEMFCISTVAGTDAGFSLDMKTGRIYFLNRVGYSDGAGVNIAYDPVAHKWWRLTCTSGTLSGLSVYWDTSPDGITWTNRRALSVAPAWVSDTSLALSLNAHRDSGVTDFAEFDNVSMMPITATMTADGLAISPTMAADVTVNAALSAPQAINPTLIAEAIPVEVRSGVYILITDENLQVVGDPISIIQAVEVDQKFNEPDSGSFKVPAYPEYMEVFVPGNRAVVIDDGEIFSAGPIEIPGGYEWDAGGEEEPGTITINFADDLASIAGRLTYPNPAQAATAQTSAYYESTANAEVVIRDLVDKNAGPGALTARRVPHLVLGALAGVGSTVVCKTRFEPVTDVSRTLASAGGGLGITVDQVGASLVFRVFAPQDKTRVARFSRGLGNLISVKYDVSKPSATTVLVGGDGEGDARTISERTDTGAEASWGRVEKWVAAQSQDQVSGGLDQTGDTALVEAGETIKLTTVTIDSGEARYGKDYNMGDLVTVEVYPGVEVEDVVREAKYTYTPEDGKQITILVGSQEATRDPEWLKITERLSSRLGNLERN